MDRVELVGVRLPGKNRLLEPVPLRDAPFEERGWRIGVVLEHLRRTFAVIYEIEAAEDRRLARLPRLGYPIVKRHGNLEFLETLVGDDVIDRVETNLVQRFSRRFELVDLLSGEPVAITLVPVDAIHRMV